MLELLHQWLYERRLLQKNEGWSSRMSLLLLISTFILMRTRRLWKQKIRILTNKVI
ncbi:hypothetical protein REPUB_Repub17cG0043400 [Reevesia pubescens]